MAKLITTVTGGNEIYKVTYDTSWSKPFVIWRCNAAGQLVTRVANRTTEAEARERAAEMAQGIR